MSIFGLPFLVDICIPAYYEGGYIQKTVKELAKQTYFSRSQVLVGAYDNETAEKASDLQYSNVRVVPVNLKGVGNARRITTEAGKSPYIIALDADTRFATDDGIEKLLDPIMKGQCRVTYCPVILDKADGEVLPGTELFHEIVNNGRYVSPFGFEPGLTMSRETYNAAGGWRDVVMWEGSVLCGDVMLAYGYANTFQMVDSTQVIASARRFSSKNGLEMLDFNSGYRDGKRI